MSRCCTDLVGVIYAVGGQTKSGNSLSTVEVYDPIQGRWKDAEAMSMLRSRVGVAVMQNRLYAIGGEVSSVILRRNGITKDTFRLQRAGEIEHSGGV